MANTVLIIDDVFAEIEPLFRALQASKLEALYAASGAEGLAIARRITPQLILCDLRMPAMTGYEFLEALNLDAALRDIPVGLLDAEWVIERDAINAWSKPTPSGRTADFHWTKPIDVPESLRSIQRLLAYLYRLVPNDRGEIVLMRDMRRVRTVATGAMLFVAAAPLLILLSRSDPLMTRLFMAALAGADLLFFGPIAVWALHALLHPTPALVIDSEGIIEHTSLIGAGRLGWSEIASVSIQPFGAVRYLCLHLRDPAGFLARQPLWKRPMLRFNARFGAHVWIAEVALNVSLEELQMLLEARLRAMSPTMPGSCSDG